MIRRRDRVGISRLISAIMLFRCGANGFLFSERNVSEDVLLVPVPLCAQSYLSLSSLHFPA